MSNLIKEIKEALAKATPGPWKWVTRDSKDRDLGGFEGLGGLVCHFGNYSTFYNTCGSEPYETDIELIANAPTWLQQAVEVMEQQQREIGRNKNKIQTLEDEIKILKSLIKSIDRDKDREIERLRAALETIDADHSPSWEDAAVAYYRCKEIAKNALEGQAEQ